ncbi:uncharacterized protein LOC144419834 [Styela clava]
MAFLLGIGEQDKALESNAELLQQMALLKYLQSNESSSASSTIYQWITAARIGNELYQRVSGKRKIEQFRAEFLAGVVSYLQKNPNASPKSQKTEIERLIGVFILQMKSL